MGESAKSLAPPPMRMGNRKTKLLAQYIVDDYFDNHLIITTMNGNTLIIVNGRVIRLKDHQENLQNK